MPRHIPVKSGLKQFGQMLTKFSGDIYDDIVKSRATNEIAEFQGLANTEIEAVDTFVAANPNLSFEEYEKRMDKAVLNMRLASEKPTTREGRFGAQVWMSRNLELAKQRMLTSAEAELSKQELRRSEVLIENFKVNLNYDGLTNHYARMVAAGTYDYETIFGTIVDGKPVGGRLEIELGAMKTAEQKLAVDNAVGIAFAVWEGTITKENPDGDLELAYDFIDADPNVPQGDKQEVESELKTRVENRRAINEEERKEAASEANKQLTDLMADNKPMVDEIKARRNILSDKEYNSWMKAAANPDVKLNYPEYDKVVDIIDGVFTGTYTQEQAETAINNGVGKYFDGTEAKALRTKLSTALKPRSEAKRPAHINGLQTIKDVVGMRIVIKGKTDRSYAKDAKAQAADLQTKARLLNDFNAYALEKPRTDEELEAKVDSLLNPIKEEVALGWMERLKRFNLRSFRYGIGPLGRALLDRRKKEKEESGFKHIAVNPETGERMGSDDGIEWQPIQ